MLSIYYNLEENAIKTTHRSKYTMSFAEETNDFSALWVLQTDEGATNNNLDI